MAAGARTGRYADRMIAPDTPTLVIIMYVSAFVLGFIIWVLIWWAIIRGAVLSALRKHHEETKRSAQPIYHGE